jgi:hypothetical protein
LTLFEGYLTLDLDSAEVFRGIRIFCRFFALKDFLRNKPLKNVWADSPTAVRFRVKKFKYLLKTKEDFKQIVNVRLVSYDFFNDTTFRRF